MILRLALLSFWLASPSFAQNNTPWFGSEASPAEQISFVTQGEQLLEEGNLSAETAKIMCPIEGCPTDQKLGKQPN